MKTNEFTFEYDGKKYNGLLDLPKNEKPSAIVVIIHGHGKTNIDNNKLKIFHSGDYNGSEIVEFEKLQLQNENIDLAFLNF